MVRTNVSFEYRRRPIDFTLGYIFKAKKFRASLLRFHTLYEKPVKGAELVETFLFEPKETAVGNLFVLHGLGSTNVPFLLWMATHLANAGVRVFMPILPGNFTRVAHGSTSGKDFFDTNVERAARFWEQSVVDVLSVVDWAKQQNLWLSKTHLFGFCLGGMVAVLLNAVSDDFEKTTLMTVGGEMATLLWNSPTLAFFRRDRKLLNGAPYGVGQKEAFLKTFEEDIKKLSQFETVEQMQRSDIHPYLKLDPLAYARFAKKERIIFIEALFDRALPKRSRKLLWEALGKPKRYVIPSGHVTWLPFQYAVCKFILRNMGVRELRRQLELLRRVELEEKK